MQCPHCQVEIKDQAKFCKHCGQAITYEKPEQHTTEPLVDQSELKDGHMMESDKELAQSESGTEAGSFNAPDSPASMQDEIQEVDSHTVDSAPEDSMLKASSSSFSYTLALIAAASSAIVIWLVSALLSFITNGKLLSTLWHYLSTNIIALPLEKAILLEQQLSSSIWFIVNGFIGGQVSGEYNVNGEQISTFQLSFPILLALLAMILVVYGHLKGISFILRRRNVTINIVHKAIVTIIYFAVTWILIMIPLLILSPKLQIPFVEAPEQLKLSVSFISSLLYSLFVFTTGAVLVWLPWKKWRKTRSYLIVSTIFTCLLVVSQLYVQLWNKRSFELEQLTGLHHNGLDLLWLNRFVAELLMSFGGHLANTNSFFVSMLYLPSEFSWQYSFIFVIGICLIIVLHALKASWSELISIAAISSWFIYIAYQFTKLGVVYDTSFGETMTEKNSFYQLDWVSGLLVPIGILIVLLGLAKLVAPFLTTKLVAMNKGWLNHLGQRKKLYAGLLILLLISSITVLNIVSDDNKKQSSSAQKEQYKVQWAKQIYLMQQAPPDYVLMKAHELWTEQGSSESKALLAVAYLQVHQPTRAQALLSESLQTSNKLFTKQQLTRLSDVSNLDNPLSAIHTGAAVATTSNEEIDYLLDEAIEANVAPIVIEILQEVEQDVLPKLVGEEATESLAVEVQLEPQYIDFMKVLEPDLVNALQKTYEAQSEKLDEEIRVQQQIADVLMSEQTLAATLAEQVQNPDEELSKANEKMNQQWQDYVKKEENTLLTLAKAAIYYGEPSRAEHWLSLIMHYGTEQEEVTVLLASLYLNGEQPSSVAMQTSAYEHALNESATLLKEKYKAVLKDYGITTNEQLEDKLSSSYVEQDIHTQLAYALLLPFEDEASTDVLYQLAKYHFQAGQIEEANKKIDELQKKVDELEVKQQYLIQKLNELPPQTSDMTVEQIQQKHELTEELYTNLEPTKGIAFSEQPLTSEQQAFSVHLSNQLLSFNKSSAQITSVQYDDGMVTLFARSDNAEITKNGLKLYDNGQDITDFELTKLSETSSFERYVMLILDQSGSMEGGKIEVATQSATDFVYAFEHQESVGLVPFSNGAHLAVPFTKNYSKLEQALLAISANGGTDIAPALMLGVNELEEADGERIAFIISDGEDSNFSEAAVRQQIIQQANAAGITIYAVGFDAGYQTLRDVAEGTGGQYISATNFESLSKSFDTIRETLSRTYQIKYKIDATDYGKHTVNLEQDNYTDSKEYTVVDPNAVYFPTDGDDADNFMVEPLKPKADAFTVTSYTPRKIVASKTGSTTITIEGRKLNEVETVTFDNKLIPFKLVNKEKLTVSLSNKHSIGTHKLTLTTMDKKEEVLTISYANSSAQQSVKFGYATLYGDFIETKGSQVTLVGDVSVDKFIYPTGDKMVLQNDEELTFKGMGLKVDKTILRQFNQGFTMTASNFGKTFSLASDSAYAEAVSSLPGLDRFGIELKLARVFTYNADMKTDDGTLNVRGGMTNFYKLYMLNKNLNKIKVKNTPIKWLPSDASASVDYAKSGYTISGTASVSLMMQGIGFDGVTLNFTYPHSDKRLILKGQVTGMTLFKMKTNRVNSTRITVEVGVHHANGLDRIGGELASNLSVPLGPSGLGLYKFGFLADWSAKNAGSVTLGIDTVADKAFDKFVGMIANIPVVNKIFDFDDGICLICVDGTVGFTEIASTNWGLNGKLSAEMIGFKVAEVTTKVNKNELELQTMKNKLIYTMDTRANIVFSDSSFRNYTTLKYYSEIDAVGLNPHTFTFVYVPAHFDYSYAELTKEKKGKTIKIQRIGSKLNIIR